MELRVRKLDGGSVIVVSFVISIGHVYSAKRLMAPMDWNGAISSMTALLFGVRLIIIQILLLSRGVFCINIRGYSVATVVLGQPVRRRVVGDLPGQHVVVCVGVASGSKVESGLTKRNIVFSVRRERLRNTHVRKPLSPVVACAHAICVRSL